MTVFQVIIIDKNNPEMLANVILDLISDTERIKFLAQNAKKRIVEDFSIHKMVKEFKSVYQNVLN